MGTSHQAALLEPLVVRPRVSGFTLIEIVLAIGILSFALMAILGLFPVAFETARDSRQETVMALIAQSIEADIRRASGATARVMVTGFNPADAGAYQDLPLNTNGQVFIAYGNNGRPWSARPGPADYANGMNGPDYLAHVTCTYNPPEHPGMARIDISVEAPAAAPQSARTKIHFVTLKRLP